MGAWACKCGRVALLIQHAEGMQRVIASPVTSLAPPCFSTFSHKRHDFRKKELQKIKCVFRFSVQLLSETLLIIGITQRDIDINVKTFSRKVIVILVRF